MTTFVLLCSAGSYKGIAEAWAAEIEATGKRRERKQRFVKVDGHTVLKQNMYASSL